MAFFKVAPEFCKKQMSIITVSKLTKSFRKFNAREGIWGGVKDLFSRDYQALNAVAEISFTVEGGELLGYIGPNGAGKSTSIKMLTGILKPTSGDMRVYGFHPFYDRKSYTKHIGVVFGQRTQLWWDIAVLESFRLLANIYEVAKKDFTERLEKLNEVLDLKEILHTPVRKLSLGQRMRSDLAASLLHGPKILFLDEPTIGLDAVGKDSIRSFLRLINRDFGTTIILTTHDLKEIEELCQRIIILDKGRIIYDGSLGQIRSLPGLHRQISIDFPGEAPQLQLNQRFQGKLNFSLEGERRLVAGYDPQVLPTVDLIKEVVGTYEIADLAITEPGIEEIVRKIYRDGIST